MYETKYVGNVKYYKYFFSRNLEHALYDKPNATQCEKVELSDAFDERYKSNKDAFYNIIKSITFDIPIDYEQSWAFVFENDNSLKRGSNLVLLLNKIKQKNND